MIEKQSTRLEIASEDNQALHETFDEGMVCSFDETRISYGNYLGSFANLKQRCDGFNQVPHNKPCLTNGKALSHMQLESNTKFYAFPKLLPIVCSRQNSLTLHYMRLITISTTTLMVPTMMPAFKPQPDHAHLPDQKG